MRVRAILSNTCLVQTTQHWIRNLRRMILLWKVAPVAVRMHSRLTDNHRLAVPSANSNDIATAQGEEQFRISGACRAQDLWFLSACLPQHKDAFHATAQVYAISPCLLRLFICVFVWQEKHAAAMRGLDHPVLQLLRAVALASERLVLLEASTCELTSSEFSSTKVVLFPTVPTSTSSRFLEQWPIFQVQQHLALSRWYSLWNFRQHCFRVQCGTDWTCPNSGCFDGGLGRQHLLHLCRQVPRGYHCLWLIG